MSEDGQGAAGPGASGHQPIFLLPLSVTILAGITLAIHIASSVIFNEETLFQFTLWFGFLPYRLIAGATDPQLLASGGMWALGWTPFTHAFLHAGWEHVLINLAWLLVFATPVARRYGGVPMLAIFLISAAAGAAAFAATTLPGVQFLVGASGGIAGLTGAATRFIFQPVVVGVHPETGQKVILGRTLAPLRSLFAEPRARYFTLVWIGLNALVPVLPLLTGTELQIAWQAHLGGFICGLLLVSLLEKRTGGEP